MKSALVVEGTLDSETITIPFRMLCEYSHPQLPQQA